MFRSQQRQKTPDVLKALLQNGRPTFDDTMSMKDLKIKGKITTMKCVVLEKF
jgi:uncharacterized Zn ribbon protein